MATVWCPVENRDKAVAECIEEGCHQPSFLPVCLGRKPLDVMAAELASVARCTCSCDCHVSPCDGPADYDFTRAGRRPVFGCQPCMMTCEGLP